MRLICLFQRKTLDRYRSNTLSMLYLPPDPWPSIPRPLTIPLLSPYRPQSATGSFLPGLPAAQMHREYGQVAGADAIDPARLTQRGRAHAVQFFAGLVADRRDTEIIEIGWATQVLEMGLVAEYAFLLADIAAILHFVGDFFT